MYITQEIYLLEMNDENVRKHEGGLMSAGLSS